MLKIDELITSSESVRISRTKKRSAFYESAFLTIDKKEISSRWDNYNLTKYISIAESANVKDGEIFNEEDVDNSKMEDVTDSANSSAKSSSTKKENKFTSRIKSLVERTKKWIKTIWEKIKKFFKALWKRIKSLFKKKDKDVRPSTNSADDTVKGNLAVVAERDDSTPSSLGEEYNTEIKKASGDIRKLSKILNIEPLRKDDVLKLLDMNIGTLNRLESLLMRIRTNAHALPYIFLKDDKWMDDFQKNVLDPIDNIINSKTWESDPEIVKKMSELISSLKNVQMKYKVILDTFKIEDAEIVE
jgi:hypothetical protein|nr:MAG TPA: hypothetical protein [Caudoviricetes sp.]